MKNKRFVVGLVSFLIILITFLASAKQYSSVYSSSQKISGKVVIIDAGHGGFDGGAVAGDGTSEKEINLKIATCLSEILALNGYDVIMTRTEDIGTEDDSAAPIRYRKVSDLKNRLNLMNSYDDAIFVSIHLNKFTASNVHGAQVFYSKNNEQSKKLGLCIQNSVKSLLQNNNDRAIKEGNKSTYLLYNAKIPAVIVECGFLSNKSELALLKNEEYQQKMAFSIFCGVAEYMS